MKIGLNDIRKVIIGGEYPSSAESLIPKVYNDPFSSNLSKKTKEKILLASVEELSLNLDARLKRLVEGFVKGISPANFPSLLPLRKGERSKESGIEIFFLGLPFFGRNIHSFLEKILKFLNPDIIAITLSPLQGFGASLLHTFSLNNLVGLPMNFNTIYKDGNESGIYDALYSGGAGETIGFFAWKERIPVIPIGIPRRRPEIGERYPVSGVFKGKEWKEFSDSIFETFDEEIKGICDYEEARKISERLSARLEEGLYLFGEKKQENIDEACYCASRLFDLLCLAKKERILVVSDLRFYSDFKEMTELLIKKDEMRQEIYTPPKRESDIYGFRVLREPLLFSFEHAQKKGPSMTAAQRLFSRELEKWSEKTSKEILKEEEIDRTIYEIVQRTRDDKNVSRGVSVRGGIAFKEISRALVEIKGAWTKEIIEKGAMASLPHRLNLKPGAPLKAVDLIREIVKEVVYGIGLKREDAELLCGKTFSLSKDDSRTALKKLKDKSLEQKDGEKGVVKMDHSFALEAYKDKALKDIMNNLRTEKEDVAEALKNLCNELAKKGHLSNAIPKEMRFTKKGIKELSDEAEERFNKGEISEEEFRKEMSDIENLPAALEEGEKTELPRKKISELVAEFMDIQHKYKNDECSLEDAYVHYAISENRGLKIDSEKLDYAKLHVMVYNLQKKGLLKVRDDGKLSYSLTGKALTWLLDELISSKDASSLIRDAFKKDRFSSNIVDIRKYRAGDRFQDISIIHTLKEIVKEKKPLEEVTRRQLRAFEKRPTQRQDIALCLDVSASMRQFSKLRFAKIAVAALSRAAVEKEYRVGVVAFSNEAEVVSPLGRGIEEIMDSVVTLRADQYTNIGKGIECAKKLLMAEKGPEQKHIILITDGQPNALSRDMADSSKARMSMKEEMAFRFSISEAEKVARRDIRISVLLITGGDQQGITFAKKISWIGRGKFYKVSAVERIPISALEMMG